MPRPKPAKVPNTITFRLDPKLRRKLDRRAAEQHTSAQVVITQIVSAALEAGGVEARVELLDTRVDRIEEVTLYLKHKVNATGWAPARVGPGLENDAVSAARIEREDDEDVLDEASAEIDREIMAEEELGSVGVGDTYVPDDEDVPDEAGDDVKVDDAAFEELLAYSDTLEQPKVEPVASKAERLGIVRRRAPVILRNPVTDALNEDVGEASEPDEPSADE